MEQQTRRAITIEQKLAIIDKLSRGVTNSQVCREYNLQTSTVSTIWRNKEKFLSKKHSNVAKKRITNSRFVNIERELLEWVSQQQQNNITISNSSLQKKANEINNKLQNVSESWGDSLWRSTSWIRRFQKRHNIYFKKLPNNPESDENEEDENNGVHFEEINLNPEEVTLNPERPEVKTEIIDIKPDWNFTEEILNPNDFNVVNTEFWLTETWQQIQHKYTKNNIFNASEFRLFYKLHTQESLAILLCTNMDGSEKRNLQVVGKSKLSQHILNKTKNFPVKYYTNETIYLTNDIMEQILQQWDIELSLKNRKITLLLNDSIKYLYLNQLTNIELMILPVNESKITLPIEQALENLYKKALLCKIIVEEENSAVDLSLIAVLLTLNNSWRKLPIETIQRCFYQAFPVIDENFLNVNTTIELFKSTAKNPKSDEETKEEIGLNDAVREIGRAHV